jgi:hypothetical protein
VSALEAIAKFAQENPNAGTGVLLAGIAPGIAAAINPKIYADSVHRAKIQRLLDKLKVQNAQDNQKRDARKDEATIRLTNANADYAIKRPDIEAAKREGADMARRQRVILGVINGMPQGFDPNDPENQDIVAELQATHTPVFRRQPNQQVQVNTDPRTGEVRVVAVNKTSGTGTASPVTENGAPLVVSTAPQMSAEQREADRKSREAEAEKNRQAADRRQAARLAAGVSGTGDLKPAEIRRLNRSARKWTSKHNLLRRVVRR